MFKPVNRLSIRRFNVWLLISAFNAFLFNLLYTILSLNIKSSIVLKKPIFNDLLNSLIAQSLN